ncbi:MAG: hypothetical protein FWH29_05520 [Methanobrevibacter sp.]|nr:hypothetical protein [Methanobrevibacter sp.]
MKFKCIIPILIFLIFLTGMSTVSAHGVDVTDDIMIITDEDNAIETKKIVDSLNLDIKVYKFTSVSDVEHQLEHAKENPNKRILAVAFHDTVNKFIKANPSLSDKIIVVGSTESEINQGLVKLNQSANNDNENIDIDYTTIVLIIVIVGLIAGFGLFLLKR